LREKLSENTKTRIQDSVDIFKLNKKLLKDWRDHLRDKCRECLKNKEDDKTEDRCDCDVQFYLDLIGEMLNNGNGFS